ncbi:MAG: putative DNA modification/repair radical SAM protein, partial [bacterium]
SVGACPCNLIMRKQSLHHKANLLGELAGFDVTGFPLAIFPKKHIARSSLIYPAAGEKGECVNLFKVLQSNLCENNCFYCVNRKDRDCPRVEFAPQELASLFLEYYKKRWVKGLFLSSAINVSPNASQEKMLETLKILRQRYNYRGYIHCKILPGVDIGLIEASGRLADRLSINLEAPNQRCLSELTPDKNYHRELLDGLRKIASFHGKHPLKAGVTTQLVVGAADDEDREILSLSHKLYKDYNLRRVYYSAFTPEEDTPLENLRPCSPLREFRLYQADFLLRKYNFSAEELIFDNNGNLYVDKDPKLVWALSNMERFPVEINKASFEELIKVPGIGRISAGRILQVRKNTKLKELEQLKRLSVVTKRARRFITLDGKFYHAKEELKPEIDRQLFLWEEI